MEEVSNNKKVGFGLKILVTEWNS